MKSDPLLWQGVRKGRNLTGEALQGYGNGQTEKWLLITNILKISKVTRKRVYSLCLHSCVYAYEYVFTAVSFWTTSPKENLYPSVWIRMIHRLWVLTWEEKKSFRDLHAINWCISTKCWESVMIPSKIFWNQL